MAFARKTLLVLAATIVVGGASGQAFAETVIRKSTSYFQVRGKTAEQLDKELSYRGPMTKSTGSRHPGATRIKFGGSVTYAQQGGRCRIDSAKITLSTQIILPEWKGRKGASKDLQLVWDTLARDIKRHEERHAEIARNYARSMEKAILKLPPQRTCAAMKAKVAKVSRDEIDRHDRDQMRFDRIEAANFDSRMIRLLRYRLKAKSE
ncbi:DUF922 domain-containing protein [Rhizobiaceae bacterium n13]|uniref:DUF922 domain-containing protein n=1 Tax=Ferirhizobium litorale TaxID=2927786 RepID=A0AAE3QJD3_9HYPH|nr:DUF922 domain-containing protein [Fererhizobium litorale]MDI7863894.1 DUF922 domain-containing protein [Fererhizobium litorale]MDI7924274.1 DUF922 domain-containing protein [Fererhizobium litorale]